MSVRYAEFEPPAELAPYVACLWTFEGMDAAADQRIVPDGRCELIVHHATPYLEAGVPQPAALFAGQLTRPLLLRAAAPAGVVGVRFRTAAARAYAQVHMADLTDRRVPLGDLKAGAGALVARVQAAGSQAAQLAAVASHVWAEVRGREPDPGVAAAVARLRATEGRAALQEVAELAGRSPRALQRTFAAEVGLSPRMLQSVVRFRRVFDALEAANWSDAAQAAGYFDHPQMARDFRRFVGCTPSEFARSGAGLAASLVDLPAA